MMTSPPQSTRPTSTTSPPSPSPQNIIHVKKEIGNHMNEYYFFNDDSSMNNMHDDSSSSSSSIVNTNRIKNNVEQQPLISDIIIDMSPDQEIIIDKEGEEKVTQGVELMSPLGSTSVNHEITTPMDDDDVILTLNNTMTTTSSINNNSKANNISSIRNIYRNDEPLNTAFLFIKPDANTEQTIKFVREFIMDEINPCDENEYNYDVDNDDSNVGIVAEYTIDGEMIQNGELIDKQYKDLAYYAKDVKGVKSAKSMIDPENFKDRFGEDLEDVIHEKRIYNALEVLSAFGCTTHDLNILWMDEENFKRESMKRVVQFASHYHCANLCICGENVYVINGFYMALRESYMTKDNNSIHAFVVQWDASSLKWKDFRKKVVGIENNPSESEVGSLRQLIYEKYEELEIKERPDIIRNAVHVSSSPLQALAEQCIWLRHDVKSIHFGQVLLSRGVPESNILDWCHDSKVKIPNLSEESPGDGLKHTSAFDLVENLDAKECIDNLIGIYDYELFGLIDQKSRCCWCRPWF